MNNYEFPDYAPNWKNEDDREDKEGYFWNEEKMNALNPEEVIDEKQGIKNSHLIQAMRNLVTEHQYSGPFSEKEIGDAISLVIIDETLKSLQAKGLVESNGDDSFRLTPLGMEVVKELKKKK